jgi:hypothetical protein
MSSRQWLEEQAAKALRDNPGLISRHELLRRQADARRQQAEHAETLAELKAIRRLLEEGK